MTDPLDTLRPEVKQAIELLDRVPNNAWAIVRTEFGHCLHDRDKFMWQVRDTCVRAEKAEAELAAVRARIAEGVYMGYPVECYVGNRRGRLINPFTPAEWIGKRVRLLVDEPQDDNAKEGRSRE